MDKPMREYVNVGLDKKAKKDAASKIVQKGLKGKCSITDKKPKRY